jgi:hypothetical protein
MATDLTVLLFDVDGVLIDPLAYRAGIFRSLEILGSEIGLSRDLAFLPLDSEIAYMESRGIHDVWDICNIMFSLVLVNVFHSLSNKNRLFDFVEGQTAGRLQEIARLNPVIERPDYNGFAETLACGATAHHPPHIALALLRQELASQETTPEAWLSSWDDLLADFLLSTRSVYESYGTRIFQNIILGETQFEATYGLTGIYAGPALLESEDRVLVSADSVKLLDRLCADNQVRAAIYTARPSYPPDDAASLSGYSPEAEMAIASAGLQHLPLVGMGMMEWLALRHGEKSENLTKPNTTHCLSALLAALAQNSFSQTLEAAYLLDRKAAGLSLADLPQLAGRQVRVFVFEDTSSGIKPLVALAERLNAAGFSLKVGALGIAGDPNKKAALAALCCKVFADVNQALDYLVNEEGLLSAN